MIVLLKLLVLFCVNFAIGEKTNDEVKDLKRFGELLMKDPMGSNYETPILASVTRVNSKLEPVSLPFLAHINPNVESILQPAFTFVKSIQSPLQKPIYQRIINSRTDGFNRLNNNIADRGEVVDKETDNDSDYFSSNTNDKDKQVNNEDSDYFVSYDKDPKSEEKKDKDPENKPENGTDTFEKVSFKGSDKKVNSKNPADEIDNYVDHKENDEFYDDQLNDMELNSTVLSRNSVLNFDSVNKLKCDDIICPYKTHSCKSRVEAVPPHYIKLEIVTECLSLTNEVFATKYSEIDNPSRGKYMFVIQTMDNEGKIEISFKNRTENDLNLQSNQTNLRRNSNQNFNDSDIKRRMAKNKSRRSKGEFSMRKDNDEDTEGPPIVITKGDKESRDHFILKKNLNSSSTKKKSKIFDEIQNKTLSNNRRAIDEETNEGREETTDEPVYNLIEKEDLVCMKVECPKEAFICRTIQDAIPPEFKLIRIIVECVSKDNVVVSTTTLEQLNSRPGTYRHYESVLNRYDELNTMSEHIYDL